MTPSATTKRLTSLGPEMESGDRGDCGIATRSFGDFGNNKTAEQ